MPNDDKPKPTIPVVPRPIDNDKASKKKPLPVIENPGAIGAEIFDSIVKRLKEEGHNMVLTRAKLRIETKALVKDNKLFGDDEEHESLMVFEGELERQND